MRAIRRPTSKTEALSAFPIEWIEGQIFDPETVSKALTYPVEYVFHLAAAYRNYCPYEEHYQVHVQSTQLLAQKASLIPTFKRFILVSTVGVHGDVKKPPADETSPFFPDDFYQQTKVEAERWLCSFAESTPSFSYTIIRPTAIFGPGDKRLLKLFKLASRKFMLLPGFRNTHYHLIYVEDLTELILLAAIHPKAHAEAFICGNSESLSLESLMKIIAKSLGNELRILRVPAWPLFLLALLVEAVCKPFKISPFLYRRRVAFFTKNRSFDTQKCRSVLGYQFKFTNHSGIQQTVEWYRAQNWLSS